MFKHGDNPNRSGILGTNRVARAGFTLVELLVVIAIIGMLVGLLLPAVNAARESGRRAACANNIKQIALATAQYETSQRQYPMNWGQVHTAGTPDFKRQVRVHVGVSWLTSLLPNLDIRPALQPELVSRSPVSIQR